jgi:hypothetical protein
MVNVEKMYVESKRCFVGAPPLHNVPVRGRGARRSGSIGHGAQGRSIASLRQIRRGRRRIQDKLLHRRGNVAIGADFGIEVRRRHIVRREGARSLKFDHDSEQENSTGGLAQTVEMDWRRVTLFAAPGPSKIAAGARPFSVRIVHS